MTQEKQQDPIEEAGGYGTPTGVCSTNSCGPRNTTVTTLRGGLRVRLMR